MVVWDLFGGTNHSVRKAIGDEATVYTFDVLDTPNTIYLDMTQPLAKIIKQLAQYPKPDIVMASPPCTAFSKCTALKGGFNAFYIIDKAMRELRVRTIDEYTKYPNSKPYNYNRMQQSRIIGEECIKNTIGVIEHFKPRY